MMKKPVIQLEGTGCGIASVAAAAGLSYAKTRSIAASLGIFADDESLWSDTSHVRTLLAHCGLEAGPGEKPFRSWEALPDLALLAIKWHIEKGKPHWHWVVFVREEGRAFVLDSNRHLRRNVRTDFRRMKPKWFIPVFQIASRNRKGPPRAGGRRQRVLRPCWRVRSGSGSMKA
jgi:hypothetical protein